MKKFLLIVPALHQGGFEKVCVVTARLLQPYFDVTIALFDSRDIVYDTDGIRTVDLHLPSRPGTVGKIVNIWRRGRKLRRLKKKERFAVAYSLGPTANLANIVSGTDTVKWLGVRSYMDMGNPRQIRLFCRTADRVVCCSETISREIREKYRCGKAVTLTNPFDIRRAETLAGQEDVRLPWEDGRVLVSMGREDPVKGYWHLIKSFAVVHAKLPDTRLMIIGQGEFAAGRKLAAELGLGGEVFFAGLQKNPYPYLKQGTLYVLTSYYEGFPNALVEAMALGLPAVATDCMTGPREILQEKYGLLVPNMSPDENYDAGNITDEERALGHTIITLLEDAERMEHYRRMAKARAAEYTAEAYTAKIREWAE